MVRHKKLQIQRCSLISWLKIYKKIDYKITKVCFLLNLLCIFYPFLKTKNIYSKIHQKRYQLNTNILASVKKWRLFFFRKRCSLFRNHTLAFDISCLFTFSIPITSPYQVKVTTSVFTFKAWHVSKVYFKNKNIDKKI